MLKLVDYKFILKSIIYDIMRLDSPLLVDSEAFKVTVHPQGCLKSKRCTGSTPGLNCRYPKPYIKLKFIELAVYI